MDYKEKAITYLSNQFNCAQAVLATFSQDLGLDEEQALMLASNFGGGARCGQLCGAVSGALMVLGLKYGNSNSGNKEEILNSKNTSEQFNKLFCEQNKSLVCKELLGYDLSVPEQRKTIMEKSIIAETCPKMVTDAVEIVQQIIFGN